MWQRFTERARRSIMLAQQQALQMQDSEVRSEHLLLGLLDESGCVAAKVLTDLGVTPEKVRSGLSLLNSLPAPVPPVLSASEVEATGMQFQVPAELVRQIESQLLLKLRGQTETPRVTIFPFVSKNPKDKSDISLAPSTKRILELGASEARDLQHNYIGTEHLLLGLLRQEDSGATKILLDMGVTLERTRAAVLVTLTPPPDSPPIAAP